MPMWTAVAFESIQCVLMGDEPVLVVGLVVRLPGVVGSALEHPIRDLESSATQDRASQGGKEEIRAVATTLCRATEGVDAKDRRLGIDPTRDAYAFVRAHTTARTNERTQPHTQTQTRMHTHVQTHVP